MRILMIVLLLIIAAGLLVAMWFENGYGHAWALSYSPDSQQLMVSYNTQTVRVWDVSREHAEPVRMTLASDQTHWVLPSSPRFCGPRLLAAFRGNRDGEKPDGYELWDTLTGRRLRIMELPYPADTFQVSGEQGLALASPEETPHRLDLFQLESGAYIGTLDGSESMPGQRRNQCILSPNGKRVAASYDQRDAGDVIKVWNTESRECIESFPIESGYGLAISHDGSILADNARDIWNLNTSRRVVRIERGQFVPGDSALSADGGLLAASSFYTGKVSVWDATDGRLLATLDAADTPMDANRRTFVAFSPDGRSLATATGRTVRVWSLPDFQLTQTLARGYRLIVAVICSIAFIVWSIVFGLLRRRRKGVTLATEGTSPRLVRAASILLALTGLLAIPNSTLGVLHPGMCSCCTPTLLLLVIAYAGLGLGIFVIVDAMSRDVEGLIPPTLMLMLFNWTSDFAFLSLAILIFGGMAVVLLGIAGIWRHGDHGKSGE